MLDYIVQVLEPRIEKNQKDDFIVPIRIPTGVFNTVESADKYNLFFEKYELPLRAKAYKISKIKDVAGFLEENLKSGNDIIAEVANKPMFNTGGGHDILIESMDSDEVTVVDPSPKHKQRYKLKIQTIAGAMDKKWGRESGFLVISDSVFHKF